MSERPVVFAWDGEVMRPVGRYHTRTADELFTVGERYALVEHAERSEASHRHYFAVLRECWQNLPEHLAPRFPTPETLRKHALIREGYRTETTIVCASHEEARRVAALRLHDDYAVVTVDGPVVTILRAQSQSQRAMGHKTFQESKDKVLAFCADLIGARVADVEVSA